MGGKHQLKVGDCVLVENRLRQEIKHITGETDKYWKVGTSLYSKSNLKLRGASGFCPLTIRYLGEEEKKQLQKKWKHKRLVREVEKLDFTKLSIEELELIKKMTGVESK